MKESTLVRFHGYMYLFMASLLVAYFQGWGSVNETWDWPVVALFLFFALTHIAWGKHLSKREHRRAASSEEDSW